MSAKDKFENGVDKLKHNLKEAVGKTKEFIGEKTNNKSLETEGREQKQEANLQQAGDHVKDGIEDAKDVFK